LFDAISDFFYINWIHSEPFVKILFNYMFSPWILLFFLGVYFTILHVNVADTSMTIATKIGANKNYKSNIPIILVKILVQAIIISILFLLVFLFIIGFESIDRKDLLLVKYYVKNNYTERVSQVDNYFNDYVLYNITNDDNKKIMNKKMVLYFKYDKEYNYAEIKALELLSYKLSKTKK